MIYILELRCESWILEMMSFVQSLKYIRLRHETNQLPSDLELNILSCLMVVILSVP